MMYVLIKFGVVCIVLIYICNLDDCKVFKSITIYLQVMNKCVL